MSGGVALIDYDRDGWPDIYFTNAPDVDMQLAGKKARSSLFHNNHDGTFTDVTDGRDEHERPALGLLDYQPQHY